MATSESTPWRSMFVGRDEELSWLQEAWERVAAGEPQMSVLRGESGLGKTRIVQALYAWLVRRDGADPHGYWPEALMAGDNLRLNPDLDRQSLGGEMRFLWWGLRWMPPDARNQGELTHCAFFDQRQMLHPHWEQLTRFKDTAGATAKLGGALGSAAIGLARDTAIAAFPLLGLVKLATGVGGAVLGIGTAARNASAEFARLRKPPAEREAEALAEQVDQVVAFLRWVLKPFHRSGSGAMPVVLVLDDAQWIDPRSVEVVERLFLEAVEAGWPLMIVATHWEREWHEQLNATGPLAEVEASAASRSFPALYASLAASAPDACEILDLEGLPDAQRVLTAAFPGLTAEQVDALVTRSDGNPRLLAEIILYLETEPDLFQGGDPRGPLESMAITELDEEMVGFELRRLQEGRYRRLSPAIREVLALASLQGVRFLADLVHELGAQVALRPIDEYADGLERAEVPHAIVSSRGLEREFRFVLFRDLALGYLERLCRRHSLDVTELQASLVHTAVAWLGGDRYALLSDSERENLLLIFLTEPHRSTAPGIRASLFAIDHYQQTGKMRRAVELAQDWQEHVGDRLIPFNPRYANFALDPTPFYRGWVVFRLQDYDDLPILRLHYATDGTSFVLLDGSPERIEQVNRAAAVAVGEGTALSYLRFYLASLYHPDGTTRLIEGLDFDLPPGPYGEGGRWTESEPAPPSVTWDPESNQARIQALVAHRGSLFEATFTVGGDGRVTLDAQAYVRQLRPRSEHFYWQAWDEYDEERAAESAIPPGDPVTELYLTGAVRPPLDDETARELLSEGRRILASAPECDGPALVQPLVSGDVTVTLLDAPREFTWCPRGSTRRFIGLPRYLPVRQDRVTLLLADVLLEDALDLTGPERPTIDEDRAAYVEAMARRKITKVGHLCAFAYDLSLRADPKVGDIQAELRAMGHHNALDAFLQAVGGDASGG
jgi:hypothetical protein